MLYMRSSDEQWCSSVRVCHYHGGMPQTIELEMRGRVSVPLALLSVCVGMT